MNHKKRIIECIDEISDDLADIQEALQETDWSNPKEAVTQAVGMADSVGYALGTVKELLHRIEEDGNDTITIGLD